MTAETICPVCETTIEGRTVKTKLYTYWSRPESRFDEVRKLHPSCYQYAILQGRFANPKQQQIKEAKLLLSEEVKNLAEASQ